jgi:hypothetical protein
MKTINVLMLFILVETGSAFGQHQTIPVYPIPSTNVGVDGLADFENLLSTFQNNSKELRKVHIHFISASPEQGCEATVIVYSLDGTTYLGPFTVSCGQTLDVNIDERDWGVMVDSDVKLLVDVWISAG